jgi:hypothetical protein
MKYLKLYEEFDSTPLEEIKDILLPIEDESIKIEINEYPKIDMFYIKLNTQDPKFDGDIEHLESYMNAKGYDMFVGRIKNQTDISFFKPSEKNREIEEFFVSYTKGLVKKTSKDHPGDVFFVDPKDDDIKLWQDSKYGWFKTRYDEFWSVFESKFHLNNQEIQAIIRYLVGKHLKLECLTPQGCGFLHLQWWVNISNWSV